MSTVLSTGHFRSIFDLFYHFDVKFYCMKRLKEVVDRLCEGATLCFHPKKAKGWKRTGENVAVEVISIENDHIMARLKEDPKRVLSIDMETCVSGLKARGIITIC